MCINIPIQEFRNLEVIVQRMAQIYLHFDYIYYVVHRIFYFVADILAEMLRNILCYRDTNLK